MQSANAESDIVVNCWLKVIDEIPLTATGKVLKRELKELVKNGKL